MSKFQIGDLVCIKRCHQTAHIPNICIYLGIQFESDHGGNWCIIYSIYQKKIIIIHSELIDCNV